MEPMILKCIIRSWLPNDQLTDGGPLVTPELPDGVAGPPFGEAPGSVILFVLASRIKTTGSNSKLQFAMSSIGTVIIHILSERG